MYVPLHHGVTLERTEDVPSQPQSYVAKGNVPGNDGGLGYSRGHHPTTNPGAVLREIETVKPAEHVNGPTAHLCEELTDGLDAQNARENGIDGVQEFGSHEGEQDIVGRGYGPAAAALSSPPVGRDGSSSGSGVDRKDSIVNPSHTYAHGRLPPPNDGEVVISGDPENHREAMAYEPNQAQVTNGSPSAVGVGVHGAPRTGHGISGGHMNANTVDIAGEHEGESQRPKGGISDKVVGKVQQAAGTLIGSDNLKAKGLERERCAGTGNLAVPGMADEIRPSRAMTKGSVDEAELLEQEAQVRRERAQDGRGMSH